MSGTAYIGKIRELWRIPKFEGHVRKRHKCQRPGRRHSKDMKEETKQAQERVRREFKESEKSVMSNE